MSGIAIARGGAAGRAGGNNQMKNNQLLHLLLHLVPSPVLDAMSMSAGMIDARYAALVLVLFSAIDSSMLHMWHEICTVESFRIHVVMDGI